MTAKDLKSLNLSGNEVLISKLIRPEWMITNSLRLSGTDRMM